MHCPPWEALSCGPLKHRLVHISECLIQIKQMTHYNLAEACTRLLREQAPSYRMNISPLIRCRAKAFSWLTWSLKTFDSECDIGLIKGPELQKHLKYQEQLYCLLNNNKVVLTAYYKCHCTYPSIYSKG